MGNKVVSSPLSYDVYIWYLSQGVQWCFVLIKEYGISMHKKDMACVFVKMFIKQGA